MGDIGIVNMLQSSSTKREPSCQKVSMNLVDVQVTDLYTSVAEVSQIFDHICDEMWTIIRS